MIVKKRTQYSLSISAWCGNLFEHYDAALFGFLSPFLAPLIFPQQEPITALILTYAMIPLGMLARPFGSLIFGRIGDKRGREQALFLSLSGMAIVSASIAFSPTYAQAGILAPIIFCIGRVMQNFFASGESMGGAIYLLENSPEKKHDWLSGLYNASTIGGILLASAGVLLLCIYDQVESGWRILYLFGTLTALFGLFLRRVRLTKANTQTLQDQNLMRLFWEYRRPLFCIMISAGFSYANYTIALVLMNGFIPLVTSFSKAQMMGMNTFLLILDFCALPFFGWLSSKVSREKLMFFSSALAALCAIPLCMLIKEGAISSIIFARIFLVLLGVAFFAPFHAWVLQLIPSSYRYLLISFGYSIGTQLFGGPTSAISLWLYKTTGIVSSIAWYWMALAFASSFVLLFTIRNKKEVAI
ncbi:MAG TPA: MFS transporter [Rhabdochlamydiaceae bacterium]|nr:MFS transporter [Rhabdochlamydiaceae bacterium]